MKRLRQLISTASTMLAIAAPAAAAQGNGQSAGWTSLPLYATGPDVWVRFVGSDAPPASTLVFACTITSSCEQLLFRAHGSKAGDSEVKLDHVFALGEEIIFKLMVSNGAANRNGGGPVSFTTDSIFAQTTNATYTTLADVGDFRGGSHDNNDLMFQFSNVGRAPVTATPEPASLVLMGTGMVAVAGLAWRRRRKAAKA